VKRPEGSAGWPGLRRCAIALAMALGACLPHDAGATGAYVFGAFGGRQVSNQDMEEFFALGAQPGPTFIPSYLGEAALTAGYRFSDPFAVELGGATSMGREESNLYAFGNLDLQVPTGSLFGLSVAPVFCFDTYGSPTSSWLHQVGLRLTWAKVSGTESIQSSDGVSSSQGFSGSAFGWGLFYRLVNLWAPSKLSVGAELGWESLRFNDLSVSGATGPFAGQPGAALENLNGAAAFIDDSGPYLRLVVGWAQDSRRYMGARSAGGGVPAAPGAGPAGP